MSDVSGPVARRAIATRDWEVVFAHSGQTAHAPPTMGWNERVAENVADESNRRAKALGIETRYEARRKGRQ